MFGYFVSSFFMKPIQAFWFVAEAAAERIAICPDLPICLASRATSLRPIASVSAWLTNSVRQAGASESYVTTVIFFLIADFSVGQSADASVAETMRASAPFLIAASAPPDLTLSAVVKYGFPRFFGMTKTLRPFFSDTASAPAIAVGTTPRTSTSPAAVAAHEARFCSKLLMV